MRGGKRAGAGRPPGRPPGAITKAKRELAEMAKDHALMALATLAQIAASGDSESARVSAATAILDRGYGKPPQLNTSNVDDFRRATDMTDDELLDIASRGRVDRPAKTNGSALTH